MIQSSQHSLVFFSRFWNRFFFTATFLSGTTGSILFKLAISLVLSICSLSIATFIIFIAAHFR